MNKIKTRIHLTLFFTICFLLYVPPVSAKVRYPITELGNCRNSKECKLYCDIPQNTPACWSYGKYLLNGEVLGESTSNTSKWAQKFGFTFPVKELGSCATFNECKEFCTKEENMDLCTNFAQKYKITAKKTIVQKLNLSIMQSAKEELGCTTKEECKTFCSLEENREKCKEFGMKFGLLQKAGLTPKPTKPLPSQPPKPVLPCENETECINYCLEHPDECPGISVQSLKDGGFIGPGGCKTAEECAKFCVKNPDQCPGFPKPTGFGNLQNKLENKLEKPINKFGPRTSITPVEPKMDNTME